MRTSVGSFITLNRKGILLLGILLCMTFFAVVAWHTGAQSNDSSNDVPKGTKHTRPINLDIRLNGKGNLDKVLAGRSRGFGMSEIKQIASQQGAGIQVGLERLRAQLPALEAKGSPMTASVEVLGAPNGLTGPHPGREGKDIVLEFISDNADIYGLSRKEISQLNFIGESESSASGLRMVRVEQIVNGLPVFQSETRFILDREGRIIRSLGLMVPDAEVSAEPLSSLISPEDALRRTIENLQIPGTTGQISVADTLENRAVKLNIENPYVSDGVQSKLVYFALAPGVLVPAYSETIFSKSADWYTIVDARDGTTLWRKNIRNDASAHDARFRVYVQADGTTPADSPAPFSPTTVTVGSGTQGTAIVPTIVGMHTVMTLFSNVSQNGWIDDCPGGGCTANETQTIGNNVHAYMDRVGGADNNVPDTAASSVIDGGGKPMGNPDANARNRDFLGTAPRDFETNYLPPPLGGNPEAGQTSTGNGASGTLAVDQFRRGMLTQLFYVSNWYHDRLFQLGFNEAAGNFQQSNFSGQGLGGDRVLAEGQDNTSTDNSNFSTPPDGQSGRAQMYRFTGPTIDRDGSLDTEVLVHELTHGTSNRLIGNGAGLVWDPAGGMGEGWSDFYALSLLNNTNADDPNGNYALGAYATYKAFGIVTYTDNYLYGIRRFPYSTNNSVNPLTWADVDDYTNDLSGGITPDPLGSNLGGAQEVHNTGEIWANTLWEVRSRVIAANAGSVPTGNQKMLQITTDAMKMTPINPTYTDARNALIDADCAANACANEVSIWDGFADRGLGYGAKVSTAYGFAPTATHQGIVESFSEPFLDTASVTVDDSLGNNNGTIDPGETIKLTVTLKNPWRNASKNVASATAALATTTPGITITDPNSTYGAIPAQGSAAGDTFQFNVPLAVTCGQSLNFTVTSTSSIGTHALNLSFRVGAPGGTGAPITYTRTLGAPLAIPDNRPRGTVDSQTITDDLVIADLNVRIDSLPHTFPGDLTFGFKAPNGYGVDLVAFIGGAVAGGGDGDNITNMVIDNQGAGDMLVATNPQAPYTGGWLPIANSPSWPGLGFGAQEPVGELNKMNGASTLGTWKVLVSDQAAVDTGTLNAWSIIVTPRAFSCVPFVAAANPTATTITSHSPNPSITGQPVTVNYTVAETPDIAGAPTGNVTVTDGVNSCIGTAAAGTCNITLTTAGVRTLTATYAGDATFIGSVSPGVAHTVQALLSVTKNGTGTGTVTSLPGITCGADCTELYNAGTIVTLTATADPGSTFTGWSGGGCSGTGTCVVTMNAATIVNARFETSVQSCGLTVAPGSSPAGGYLALSLFGITPVVGVGDDTITNFNVPAFTFGGETYTAIGFSSNGYAILGGGSGPENTPVNQSFPNSAPPNNVLAPFWTNLNPAGGGALRIGTLTDGADTWIVMDWAAVKEFGTANTDTFEIWIGINGDAHPGEDVSYAYSTIQGNGNGGLLTVGAENKLGTFGQNVYFNGAGTLPANGTQLRVSTTPCANNLGITKTDGVASAPAGSTVTYTIVASNAGPGIATGATVVDNFPAALGNVQWTCASAGGAACGALLSGTGNINQAVNLPVGGAVTYTAAATISTNATGTLSNTATVSVPAGAPGDPVPGNNTATDVDTLTAPSVFVIDDVQHLEGQSGTTPFVFTVTKNGATGFATAVQYQTFDGTATVADNDYVPTSGTLNFGPFETQKTITVLVNGDAAIEPNETFFVRLSNNPVNGLIGDGEGQGTIINEDPVAPPTPTPVPTPTPTPPNRFEGDINRTAVGVPGTGDQDVNIADQLQYQKFLSGADCPSLNEQPRLDAGPLATKGDGLFGSTDGGAIDAYARHDTATDFNPNVAGWQPTPVGGPATITNLGCTPAAAPESGETAAKSVEPASASAARVVRVVSRSGNRNADITVDIEMTAQGNEAGTQYGLHFDPTVLAISSISGLNTNPDVMLGEGAPSGTTLNVNAADAANGNIGIVENFNGAVASISAIPAGAARIARVRFHVLDGAASGTSRVDFDNSVINGVTSDVNGMILSSNYEGGDVSVSSSRGVTVSGRVTSSDGRGIRGATVTIVDDEGFARTVTTSSFGYYTFDDVAAATYTIAVSSRRNRFGSRTITVADNLVNADFTGLE